jgi:hypothetical protein
MSQPFALSITHQREGVSDRARSYAPQHAINHNRGHRADPQLKRETSSRPTSCTSKGNPFRAATSDHTLSAAGQEGHHLETSNCSFTRHFPVYPHVEPRQSRRLDPGQIAAAGSECRLKCSS